MILRLVWEGCRWRRQFSTVELNASYYGFRVPAAFPAVPTLAYRLGSRLVIAEICEADKAVRVEGRVGYEADKCGAHYFVMSDEGPRLIRRVLDDK